MRNIKLIIEYDGKNYEGWQSQPGKPNIQGEIEEAIEKVTGEKVKLIASGRTDSGVHALGQTANFKTNSNIPAENFPFALNCNLKNSIVIKHAEEVPERFHSRYSCKAKTYRYIINNAQIPSALNRYRECHIPQKLDVKAMQKAIEYFIGEHDFKGFKASGTSNKDSVRTIFDAKVTKKGDIITIELRGNGFLYNMVRIIAGTLVDVGLGKINPEDIPSIIESKDRTRGGKTLPPQGLYLINVEY